MGHVGTGGDPTGSSVKSAWDAAADVWNFWGARAASAGLKLYTHNHDTAYGFLLDSGPLDANGNPTRSTGLRKLEYFLSISDPDTVWLEMDIYWAHVAQYKFKTLHRPGRQPADQRLRASGPGRCPYEALSALPRQGRHGQHLGGRRLRDGALRHGRHRLRHVLRPHRAKGYHNPMYEQDNAPGSAASPGQSLQYADISYNNMAALRG
jgi:hypothetical protein